MHPAHVFIGRFVLQVPLSIILVGAVAVVTASFGLIYLLPPRREKPEGKGTAVPRPVVMGLQGIALVYLVFVIVVGIFGRQGNAALNAAVILFWIVTIPILPLAHCVIGGMYEVANPFALLARLLTAGGSARKPPSPALARLGYWPAVGLMFLLVWFELALRVVPNTPIALGLLVIAYTGLQVGMGIWLGEGWFRGGDVFDAITSLASTIAPTAIARDGEGFVRFKTGFRPARFLPEGPGREALITLWLAGVLADGVRVTPIWAFVTSNTQDFATSGAIGAAAQSGTTYLGGLVLDTGEILFTWAAFGAFFWLFSYVAASLSQRDVVDVAQVVSPSLIPIALAYLLAHNLTQLLIIAPLMVTGGNAPVGEIAQQIQSNIRQVSPPLVFTIQVLAIVVGHVLAVITAHARLSRVVKDGSLALRGDLGWLAAMLIYTATSLWILAQPITNQG
jgi:hypothetical protein